MRKQQAAKSLGDINEKKDNASSAEETMDFEYLRNSEVFEPDNNWNSDEYSSCVHLKVLKHYIDITSRLTCHS